MEICDPEKNICEAFNCAFQTAMTKAKKNENSNPVTSAIRECSVWVDRTLSHGMLAMLNQKRFTATTLHGKHTMLPAVWKI
jgi:hypothetical protein